MKVTLELKKAVLRVLQETGRRPLSPEALAIYTNAQADLHATLVSETARKIFDVAKHYGAIGWKVNGAGGDGGSVTILSGSDRYAQKAMLEEIKTMGDGIREIGVRLNDGGVKVISD